MGDSSNERSNITSLLPVSTLNVDCKFNEISLRLMKIHQYYEIHQCDKD